MKLVNRYDKSTFHRVIHADGCIGDFSPRGGIRWRRTVNVLDVS